MDSVYEEASESCGYNYTHYPADVSNCSFFQTKNLTQEEVRFNPALREFNLMFDALIQCF